MALIDLSHNLSEKVFEETVEDSGCLNWTVLLQTIVFDKEKNNPKYRHEVELTLSFHATVFPCEILEYCPILFVDTVSHVHFVYFLTQPSWSFPPFHMLKSYHIQENLFRKTS